MIDGNVQPNVLRMNEFNKSMKIDHNHDLLWFIIQFI